jgi:pimeloyl-ACP methyl ester carboxylesterase
MPGWKLRNVLALTAVLASCRTTRPDERPPVDGARTSSPQVPESWLLVDHTRQRRVPVAVYDTRAASEGATTPVVLLSHGHGVRNTEYGFLARALSASGYLVLSVQHAVPGDPPLPTGDNLYQRRRPIWTEGVRNLRFVLAEANRRWTRLDPRRVILIGHSNGGDLSALMATEHPELISDLITLDHRRMPLPRARRPRQLSLRAGDVRADPGVLPTADEQQNLGIRVVELPRARHADLSDQGPESVQREVAQRILEQVNRDR